MTTVHTPLPADVLVSAVAAVVWEGGAQRQRSLGLGDRQSNVGSGSGSSPIIYIWHILYMFVFLT